MWTTLISVVIVAGLTHAKDDFDHWASFKTNFNKSYTSNLHEQERLAIFQNNFKLIESHNIKYEKGLVSFKLGINQFADLTQEEFKHYTGYKALQRNFTVYTFDAVHKDLPVDINWNELGAVTQIKDQGLCGSCWSFSATGSLEGQYFLKNNQLVSLSEQNLVDCSGAYGDYGCGGGMMDYAFQYVHDFGVMSEKDYPYMGMDGACLFDPTKAILKSQAFVDIPSGNEDALKSAVGTIGPVSIAIDASSYLFQLYAGGVYDNADCGNSLEMLDHGVLLVGYGTDSGNDFWLVKNSWGGGWGESGYLRMSRNKNNQCGIATAASYPIL